MKPITNKIPVLYKRILYLCFTTSWLTGLTFFILDTWMMVEGEFGPEKHFLQTPALEVHAISAFLMIFFFGGLVFGHYPRTKRLDHSKGSGNTLMYATACSIVSAYLLYYVGDELVREYVAYLHLCIGFSLPIVLIVHIQSHKKHNKKLKR